MSGEPSDSETVRAVAHLARLAVSDDQVAHFAQAFRRILHLAEQVGSADTQGVEPLSHPMDLAQRLRPDQVIAENRREAFLKLAPAADDEHFLVPRVIE